jgi:hypothetical protein
MVTRVLRSVADRDDAWKLVESYGLPCTLNVKKGKDRSTEQNRLQRLWLNEAADQLGQSAEELRAYCKLHFGVPILRNEDEDFRAAYDRVIRPHSYEDKLCMMAIPLDFPVSRLMTTGQHKRYLDDVYGHFTAQGVKLTEPDES